MEDMVIERRVCWNRSRTKAKKKAEAVTASKVQAKVTTPGWAIRSPHRTPKSDTAGNKHARNFQRKLTEHEEALIKRAFLKLNGIFDPNKQDCSRIRDTLPAPDEISVFQVSGYVTKLHRAAASGELELKDRRAYLTAIRAHRKHWLTYEGEKYDQMRERKGSENHSSSQIRPDRVQIGKQNHRVTR